MEFNKLTGTIECVYCNTLLPEGTKFCMKCGKPIETILLAINFYKINLKNSYKTHMGVSLCKILRLNYLIY